jgi:3-phenylpropionate/cinnamic acid dioxygenase small subunit
MSINIEEKLEIHELLSRAAYAYDEREIGMLEACFAEQASFSMRIAGGDLIGPFESKSGIMDLMTGSMAEQTDVRRHVISNIFFEVADDKTVVISNLTLMATENDDIQLLSSGVYRDQVIKENGQWCIASRYLELDKLY